MNVLGIHLMLELRQCNPELLNDLSYIKDAMVKVAKDVGAHIVGESFHKFSPQGVTGVLAIAESHICIHTWPEYAYAAADIFTCGDSFEPKKAADALIEKLESKDSSIVEYKRGVIPQPVSSY